MDGDNANGPADAARPGLGRHHRERFGPVEVELWGRRAVCSLDVGGHRPVRLVWSDDVAGSGAGAGAGAALGSGDPDSERLVGSRLAALLRTTSGGPVTLDRPEQVRVPGDRKITDPVTARPSVVHSLTATATPAGVLVEVVVDGDVVPVGDSVRSSVGVAVPASALSPSTGAGTVTVSAVVPAAAAHRLADLLEAWSAHRLLFG